MDDRIDDDDGHLSDPATAPSSKPRTSAPEHPRRPMSHSQPLIARDPAYVLSNSAKRNALRKHSLDDDRILPPDCSPSSSSNPFCIDTTRSYSYSHYVPPHLPSPGRPNPASLSTGDPTGSPVAELSEFLVPPGALPEFIGRGGGTGIFKPPLRAPTLPNRPPPLEIRPHPYRETQVNSFLRTIAYAPSQLWAGHESGVRVWELEDVYKAWDDKDGGFSGFNVKRGDEQSAPFRESCCPTSPTLCLVVDAANKFVFTGHKDGRIRIWMMELSMPVQQESTAEKVVNGVDFIATTNNVGKTTNGDGVSSFTEVLAWVAHRSAVLSMAISANGELWSGFEGGVIKVWPWEAIEKSLSKGSDIVERSYMDLRNLVNVGGVCALPAADIKYLLSDHCRSKMWSGGYQTFALWDSRSKELLKVFALDGQVENRVDMPSDNDPHVDDEIKIKLVPSSKKEKSQGSLSFFQRSRNALFGAADAVRRAAAKGAFGEVYRRVESLVMAMDGMIWTGCSNGTLVQWDGSGNRIQEIQHLMSSVKCLSAYGTCLWAGYANGTVQVLDLKGKLVGGWVAHNSQVIKMDIGGSYVFTLANHGGVRGWSLASPGPLDSILRSELSNKEISYTKLKNFKILVGTWNVGQGRASHECLTMWLGSAAVDVDVVVVGLQEVEMGAGFLAMAAAKETVGSLEGSSNGNWWSDALGKVLDEDNSFVRVGSRQLAGLLLTVWARKTLRPYMGDVDAAAVPCGFGRAIGNKGAVGLRMRIYDRIVCFVNCHFAAHLEAVNRRNADFDHVYRNMIFTRSSNSQASAAISSSSSHHRGANANGTQFDDGRPELSEADMVVFLGDFNYRLHSITYDEARDFVSQRMFDWLRDRDQLRAEMKSGKVFQGMREGLIRFPPTYKFERHQAGLGGYDSGEKKRIPAWCDRILYRDNRLTPVCECSLECPIVSSISEYDACLEVTGSDHKPVRCIFNVEMAHIDELIKRQAFGDIINSNEQVRSMLSEFNNIPETVVSTNDIKLQKGEVPLLQITNNSEKDISIFCIICEGQFTVKEEQQASELCPRISFGFPQWIKVSPAAGIIKPLNTVDVSVHHDDCHNIEEFEDGIPHKWWVEDTRDKEVILLVNYMGSSSGESRSHRIRIHHCCTTKSESKEHKKSKPKPEYSALGGSSDVINSSQMRCH
ncbi:putative inositol-polyphosphate 5-phosphatase transcription factor WD40-like family [Dioscorea sansibarensis]